MGVLNKRGLTRSIHKRWGEHAPSRVVFRALAENRVHPVLPKCRCLRARPEAGPEGGSSDTRGGCAPHATAWIRLRICLKTQKLRHVGARGLQESATTATACGLGPQNGRVFKQALRKRRNEPSAADAATKSSLTTDGHRWTRIRQVEGKGWAHRFN